MLHDVVGSDGPTHLPGTTTAKAALALLSHPRGVARRGMQLAGELARIAAGRSDVSAEKGDRRFKDAAWQHNPALHRLMQAYVATAEAVDRLIGEADLDWRSEQRLRFAAGNVIEALAPSNFPLTNPTVLKAAIDSGGLHFVQGLRNLLQDLRSGSILPSTVDTSGFTIGENLAATPGAVVARTEVYELLQYHAQTDEVREAPVLLVPQMINKYYIADLAPGKSLLEYALTQGQQVFAISWRNPDERHADWNLDTYCEAVLTALETMRAHPERAVDLLHTGRSATSLRGYFYQLAAGSGWSSLKEWGWSTLATRSVDLFLLVSDGLWARQVPASGSRIGRRPTAQRPGGP